jgi:hypothetical protein
MSPINFEIANQSRPDLADTLTAIQAWLESRKNVKFLDAERIGYELRTSAPTKIWESLELLRELGFLQNKLRLRAPEGVILPGDYDSLDSIPERVWNSDHSAKLSTENCEPVAGYLLETASGER